MSLKRTSIIPWDDSELAKGILNSFLQKEFMIVMIILGDTDAIREALPKADNLAMKSYFRMERWILWVRNHEILEAQLKAQLKDSDDAHANAEYQERIIQKGYGKGTSSYNNKLLPLYR